jgi:hypothetical protein
MSLPPSPFPSYRAEALRYLRHLHAASHDDVNLQYIETLRDACASDHLPSIMLPNNGLFLSRKTPMRIKPAGERAPFSEFLLEYSITPNWEARSAADTVPVGAVVLAVMFLPNQGVHAWATSFRTEPDNATRLWSLARVGVKLDARASITVEPTGRVVLDDVVAIGTNGQNFRKAKLASLVGAYTTLMQSLAQLLTILADQNVCLRQVATPANTPGQHYVLDSSGPTPFAWLPNTGMVAVH